jgi:hypothetical protein
MQDADFDCPGGLRGCGVHRGLNAAHSGERDGGGAKTAKLTTSE